ncbi:MAG: diguanylate cyclase [Sedimenticola sp.]
MRNLSLSKASLLLNIVVFSAVGFVLLGIIQLKSHIELVGDAWLQFEKERAEKVRLENALRSALGYGGMVHDYKNYILRGGAYRFNAVNEEIGAAHTILKQYEALGTSQGEAVAIDDIRTVLSQYALSIQAVVTAKKEGRLLLREIDLSQKIDDALAIRGLETLRQESKDRRGGAEATRSKAELSAALRATVGFGGMIHHFKNYVLRQQPQSGALAKDKIDQALSIISTYRQVGVTRAEEVALADIETMLKHYRGGIDLVVQLAAEKSTIEALDQAVKVDDSHAIRGLITLDREVARSIESSSGVVTDTMVKIGGVEAFILWSLLIGATTTGLLILWLIHGHIVLPIKKLSHAMRDMAGGNLKITIPEIDRSNEIGEMARSMEFFRVEAINRHKAEKLLAERSEEVRAQLKIMQELRERSDKQAGQALALAESLTAAREETERAIRRAEADEHRIRAILDTVKDAIITADERGVIETFNPGASVIFGYQPDEVIGRNVSMLMPEPMRSEHDGYLARYLSGAKARLVGQTVEQKAVHRDGTIFPIDLGIGVMLINGERKFTGVIRDITDRKQAEKEVRRLAMTDPLTGLANRNRFHTSLEAALKMAERKNWQVALVTLDLDRFKPVNDSYGHQVGDELLKQVAGRLLEISRETDTVARLGGDEFSIMLVNVVDYEATKIPVQRILNEMCKPFNVNGKRIEIGGSIGIALSPEDAQDSETLIRRSDLALYSAKEGGRNRYCYYNREMEEGGKKG